MRKPNLLIAGAQKSGTTWLHAQLQHHPDVFMSAKKELNYFHNGHNVPDPAGIVEYLSHFREAQDERYVGESTPHYFWRRRSDSPFSAPRKHDTAKFIWDTLGSDVVIVISLRDPVSRAVSAYHHNFSRGRIAKGQSVFHCDPRMGLVDLGFYKRHWSHWAQIFGPQLRLLLFDDLEADPATFLRQACGLLDLPVTPGFWQAANPDKRIGRRRTTRAREQPSIPAQEVAALRSIYEDDIRFVEELSCRELPRWRDLDYLLARNATDHDSVTG